MMDGPTPLSKAVEALHSAYQHVRELTGTSADTVTHAPSATTYLLPETQVELQRMERSERLHSAERAAILDALPAHVAILDRTGVITAVNEAWRRFARENGYLAPHDGVGSNYMEVCASALGAEQQEGAKVACGIEAVLSGQVDQFTFEYPCHSPERNRWFLMKVTPLGDDDRRGAVTMHVDISERYRAEERESELQRLVNGLVDQAVVGILVHRNYVPILANPEIARIFGYDGPADILALKDCRVLIDDADRAILDLPVSGPEQPANQIRGRRPDGKPIMVEFRSFWIKQGDDPATCLVLTDVTDQLMIEDRQRASRRLEAIGQLTGGIAHDFNNLLAVILGSAELVSAEAENPRLHTLSETIITMAEKGADLTKSLLAFSRLQPLRPTPTDINETITAMKTMLRPVLGAQIEVSLLRAPGLWTAMIDPGELDNAFLNLCINARDALPDGGKMTIETANIMLDAASFQDNREVIPGPYVMVSVTDDGIGMNEETRKRVFEPFFSTKEVGKGSGLGLSMVYGFVKQSKGHVQVHSRLGKGTSVKMYLPRATEAEGDANSPVAAGA